MVLLLLQFLSKAPPWFSLKQPEKLLKNAVFPLLLIPSRTISPSNSNPSPALLLQPSPSETSTTIMARWSGPRLRVSCMKLHGSWSPHSSKVLPAPLGDQKIPFGVIDKSNNNKHWSWFAKRRGLHSVVSSFVLMVLKYINT